MKFIGYFLNEIPFGEIFYGKPGEMNSTISEIIAHLQNERLKQFSIDELNEFEAKRIDFESKLLGITKYSNCIEIENNEIERFSSLAAIKEKYKNPGIEKNIIENLLGRDFENKYEILNIVKCI